MPNKPVTKKNLNSPTGTRSGVPSPSRSAANMDRRRFLELSLLGSGALAAGLLGPTACAWPRHRRPDIYFIMIDSLRSDHLGCYGYERPTTPAIDRLAADSLLFERTYAAAPWTTASVAGMLTSQSPSALGIRDRVVGFDPRYPSLPTVLRDNGYRTEGVVSVDMLNHKLGFDAGFDHYDDTHYTGREGLTSPQVMAKATEIASVEAADPLFAFIHTFDPHYNYIQHKQWNFYPEYKGHLYSNYPILKLWAELKSLTPDDVRYLRAVYDSEIAFTDHYLGQFLAGLRETGRYDDALIIVAADHGEELYERGWVGHSITVHREMLQVPLLIKLPGNGSARIATPMSLLDIMPSLLRFLDIKAPADLGGFAHDLTTPDQFPVRPIFSETYHAQQHIPGGMDPIALAAVQVGNHKMIHNGITSRPTMYNLANDPGEFKPRAPNGGTEDEALRHLLVDWLKHTNAKLKGAQTKDGLNQLNREQLKRLKSLGYI